MKKHLSYVITLLVLLAGCTTPVISQPTPTATSPRPPATHLRPTPTKTSAPPSPTLPSTATATATPTSTSVPCQIVATRAITIYERPSTTATVFATLDAGTPIRASARTSDGWYGFGPSYAQAANIGIFRLRWVQQSKALKLSGDCDTLPIVEGPPPGVCFTMPMEELDVHAAPDASSDVVAHLTVGDYAEVIARGPEWAQVDLSQGNTGQRTQGWIPTVTLNLNGPCDNLPTPIP